MTKKVLSLIAAWCALSSLGFAQMLDNTPPASGDLFRFEMNNADYKFKTSGANAAIIEHNGQKALKVVFSTGENYPNVLFPVPNPSWNLTGYSGVQVDATNTGTNPARVFLRVDNPGKWQDSPWDVEAVVIPPGETKTIQVTFGLSNGGAPGFPVDPAKVVSIQAFMQKPKDAHTIILSHLKAFGSGKDLAAPLSTPADRDKPITPPEWIGQRPPVEGNWVQTLNENFDGTKLNDKFWDPRTPEDEPHQGETQRYAFDNISLSDGILKIKCEKRKGRQYDLPNTGEREYTTGAVTSFGKWTQCYGYFEARMKLPTARGLWPAFWMMPDRGPDAGAWWARQATENGGMEIDIMEYLTEWGAGRYNLAVHWDGYGKNHKQWDSSQIFFGPTPDGWHTWGLLWEPKKITWYCDGIKKGEFTNDRVGSVPTYILFCVQMGSSATKDVDVAKLPDYFEIDYCRAWQLKERLPEPKQ